MMDKPTPMMGITTKTVETPRLQQHVYFSGLEEGIPVLFLHGNFSAALYWEETLLALPEGYRGIAPDLRGYGWTEDKRIDSTRGMRDWSDDLLALMDTLGIEKAHVVGWSMGGGIVYQLLTDAPERFLSVTLISPVSPFGFGGTKDVNGAPCYDDYAGSGGGVVNPTFVSLIKQGDRGTEDPNSPRNVINAFYYKPPFRAIREEDFLTASLMEKTGDDRYPGDMTPSPNWPTVAPGVHGPVNAWSPKYVLKDVPLFIAAEPKVPILWIRGSEDQIVADMSMFDFGALGKLGFVPGWPGDEIYPPQPMVSQTRAVLEEYGPFEEHVIPETAHSPHIEKPEAFNGLFHEFLERH
ncbi:MAG: alpha/beta hydrolase [Anaerolineae bacterium]|nr:alpha/beta hydrolase [Anaerolineae bacterium]